MQRIPFTNWMQLVNKAVIDKCGLSAEDLPDYTYRDAYDQGRQPKAVAASVIRAAKEY